MDAVVLVCCHKKDKIKEDGVYKPIHVGKALSSLELPYQGDDCGDNISVKNKSYCELTGLYWAWKNMKGVRYIGLCHYRRYFNVKNKSLFSTNLKIKTTSMFSSEIIEDLTPEILGNHDIILSEPTVYPYSLRVDYSYAHLSEDYLVLKQVVRELYPDYLESFIEIMEMNNKLSHYNMFYTKWDIFDNYCSWLFCLLQEVETRINISEYNDIQARIYGYMAERLLNVYVHKNKLKIKYFPLIWVTDDVCNKSIFRYCINKIRKNLSFWISRPRKIENKN